MTEADKRKSLSTLPWHALVELAGNKGIAKEQFNGKEKSVVVSKIVEEASLSDEEIETLVNDYIYGDRITFTLWTFEQPLVTEHFDAVKGLEGINETELEANGFRNLSFLSIKECADRFEILYVYSKEYCYVDEDGRSASVWEQHRGCLWLGIDASYLACISKHEKMMLFIVKYIAQKTKVSLIQMKPPKTAIDRCMHHAIISRIVLQSREGEKTVVSRSEGITVAQHDEIERIRGERFDTSGSYIAELTENVSATIKYNVKKGSIGILRHLSAKDLFAWTQSAINIIFEEIEALKSRSAEELFRELGLEIKWAFADAEDKKAANWFLSQVIASINAKEERTFDVPDFAKELLPKKGAFLSVPKIYCETCEDYEAPHCSECGKMLTITLAGRLVCECGAPTTLQCSEGHHTCSAENWYIPVPSFSTMIDRNIRKIFKKEKLDYAMCVMGETLHIVPASSTHFEGVDVLFDEVECFSSLPSMAKDTYRKFAVKLNEKCGPTCSKEKIRQCINDGTMVCLPKMFYSIVPNFRLQPHKGLEYGDFSGELRINEQSFETKGIIKKNSSFTAQSQKTADELMDSYLLSTTRQGEEIVRQLVEQGLSDNRADLIAIVAPQYFDGAFKGTLRFLAKMAKKKLLLVELDEVARLLEGNSTISLP